MSEQSVAEAAYRFLRDWILIALSPITVACLLSLLFNRDFIVKEVNAGILLAYAIAVVFANMDDLADEQLRTKSSPWDKVLGITLPIMKLSVAGVALVTSVAITIEASTDGFPSTRTVLTWSAIIAFAGLTAGTAGLLTSLRLQSEEKTSVE